MNVVLPNKFILLIDKDGDAVDVMSANSSVDHVFTHLRIFDNEFKNDAPHSAWKYDGDDFNLVEDVCHVSTDKFRDARSIKLEIKKQKLKDLGYEEPTEEQKARGNFGAI